jgi:hypothetical protein
MTISKFIEEYSHNNPCCVENINNIILSCKIRDNKYQDILMDWMIKFTNIADLPIKSINIVEINNKDRLVFKIDSDITEFYIDKDKVNLENCPVWFYDEVHNTHTLVGEA